LLGRAAALQPWTNTSHAADGSQRWPAPAAAQRPLVPVDLEHVAALLVYDQAAAHVAVIKGEVVQGLWGVATHTGNTRYYLAIFLSFQDHSGYGQQALRRVSMPVGHVCLTEHGAGGSVHGLRQQRRTLE
jgi:hypothetical protein